jgi:uncharacterized protein YbjT (DUF2867 family)
VIDKQKIAITGGTGFVGRSVLEEGIRRDQLIAALTRNHASLFSEKINWIKGGLENQFSLEDLVGEANTVIHIAGLTNTPNPSAFEDANVKGTSNIIRAMKQTGARNIIFVSSLAAREPSLSAYGMSKAGAEKLIQESGLNWTIVRPPAVYGPHDKDMLELFKFAKFGFLPLPPNGVASIIHVSDLARLLWDLVATPEELKLGYTFEPDDGKPGGWGHKELAIAIGGSVGKRIIPFQLAPFLLHLIAFFEKLFRGSNAKLTHDRVSYMCHPDWRSRRDFRVPSSIWQPLIDGKEGLASTADWYQSEGWL